MDGNNRLLITFSFFFLRDTGIALITQMDQERKVNLIPLKILALLPLLVTGREEEEAHKIKKYAPSCTLWSVFNKRRKPATIWQQIIKTLHTKELVESEWRSSPPRFPKWMQWCYHYRVFISYYIMSWWQSHFLSLFIVYCSSWQREKLMVMVMGLLEISQ